MGLFYSEVSINLETETVSLLLTAYMYGHLGEVRHRSEWVEYRVEQWTKKLGDRLEVLETTG